MLESQLDRGHGLTGHVVHNLCQTVCETLQKAAELLESGHLSVQLAEHLPQSLHRLQQLLSHEGLKQTDLEALTSRYMPDSLEAYGRLTQLLSATSQQEQAASQSTDPLNRL